MPSAPRAPRDRYVELHCHSTFSLLDGASSPEALVTRAAELGHPALALTDHDDLGGVVRFAQAAAEAGLGGIVGVELTLEVPAARRGAAGAAGDVERTHLVLLAETREGYGNLATLVTRARMDRPRGRAGVPLDVVAAHARGLTALTGCPRGWVPARLAAGDERGAREALGTLADVFGGHLAVECWDHGLAEERRAAARLLALARAAGAPWVPTGDVHYARASGRVVHDVLCAVRAGRTLDAMGTRLRPSGEWHLRSAAQVRRRWAGAHGDAAAAEGLRATLAVAERCAFRLEDLRPSLPAFPLPPGVSEDEYLARLVEQGASERWAGAAAARRTAAHDRQIAHELDVIRRLGLAGYFLIVWDLVRFARREGILCQGRGSAANSVVCYCLGITAVDPVRMGLLFERFLSDDRQEPPDIDVDFAHRERERVLQYVYERYGRDHAAMVCEHITYRGKSAVRDAARALGFSVEQANALSLLSDRFSAKATAERLRAGVAGAAAAAGDAAGKAVVAAAGAGGATWPAGGAPPDEIGTPRPEPVTPPAPDVVRLPAGGPPPAAAPPAPVAAALGRSV
ncbi:MAG: PHP domain-containing protein, partial [Gemmatimonadaceae bacterium]